MKANIFKYIFIIFVVILVGYAIYVLYNNSEKEKQLQQESSKVEKTKVEMIKDIRVGITGFDNINPFISKNKEILYIDQLIFEPLVRLDENYKLQLCLATECSKTSPTTYVIKIDNNIKWQDGSNLIAKDIQFTVDRLKEGKSVYSEQVRDVKAIEILDASTIKIELHKEVPFFEYYLTFPILPSVYYFNEDMYQSTKPPIGTGMYKIDKIESNKIELTKNLKYHNIDEQDCKIETIKIFLYSSMGEVYNSFKIGNVDLINTSNPNFQEYIGTIGFQSKQYKGREYDFLSFNCQDSILSDVAVRKAISYAIDRENIISSVYNNQRQITNYPLDYGNYLYNEEISSSGYNPEQTKKILQDAGWTYRNNRWQKTVNYKTVRLNLTISVLGNNEKRIQVAENIKNQLEQVGIKVNIQKLTDAQYTKYLQNKDYQILLTGVYNSYNPDLNYYFGIWNLANYKNDEVTSIMNEIPNITDFNLLKEKYKLLQKYEQEEIPYFSLYRNYNTLIGSQALAGELNPNNYYLFYGIENWYRQ